MAAAKEARKGLASQDGTLKDRGPESRWHSWLVISVEWDAFCCIFCDRMKDLYRENVFFGRTLGNGRSKRREERFWRLAREGMARSAIFSESKSILQCLTNMLYIISGNQKLPFAPLPNHNMVICFDELLVIDYY